jgi:RimJ/RimL family protein N-acetyltransferase
MPHFKKMVGEKCFLSPLSAEDAQRSTAWDNDLEFTIPLGDEAYIPTSLEKTTEQINEAIRRQAHAFSIIDLASDELIGRCALFDIDPINRGAMLGIGIGEKAFWNKGYGQEATRLLLDYGFNLLNLNNIMLGVLAYNARAIHCYQKVGSHEIGHCRQARIINGQKYDLIFMDILAEEFQSLYVNKFIPVM